MKEGIHPEYVETTVSCACGYTFVTRSTKPVIKLEICSHCHPFITGKQKLIDTAGRVERFQKRFAKTEGKTVVKKEASKPKVAPKASKAKRFSTSPHKVKTETKKEAKESKEAKLTTKEEKK